MDRAQLAKRIAEVPELYEGSSKSTACILKDVGFPQTRHDVAVEEMMAALRDDPDLVDLWIERGTDQILSGGWGIEPEKEGFRIKHYGSGKTRVIQDRTQACAEFIVHYVGFIADVLAKWN